MLAIPFHRSTPPSTLRTHRDRAVDGLEMSYLDVKVIIDLDSLSEHEDVLHDRGELPHVPYPLQQRGGLSRLRHWL
jgi:hypothetical protein